MSLSLLLNIVLKVFAMQKIRKEKKKYTDWEGGHKTVFLFAV